ncbi:extracellular solute-binding protein [Caldicoprobacter faecalis]|uniref:Carbohydrate ABC transporter substrate-binding protein, CUT1 family n=1 Tax=Caldicoprobacter faecalis TaxID=937334 RepID=A0A1I5YU19_9FIRM|nr:extracellular solute-binding protein [Caldicoprobacter faecalis]SFQ47751.1 carbohydrate ABC transporter substrate-binding protein, CUT1 family [Caldicoprobacter faecalis]
MRLKKVFVVLLCISFVLSLVVGCTSSETADKEGQKQEGESVSKQTDQEEEAKEDEDVPPYLNKEGFPIVKEPITLRFMVRQTPVQPPHEEIFVWQEYEKMTGVKIEWINVPDTDLAEKRNLAIASGDLPDAFIRCNFPDLDVLRYGEQGIFIELNDLIDKYAPNLKACMEKYPEVKKGLPEYNGKIYATPVLFDSEAIQMGTRLFIRRTWVDKLGLSMPTTTDELYNVLKAFKEGDPNGNGQADEIPWTSSDLTAIEGVLKGAWGLQNRGSKHPYVDMNEETNELRFIYTTDEMKELWQYLNKLYVEGLLDQEIFTMDHPKLIAKGEQNLVGAFCFVNSQAIGATHEKEYEGIPEALEGPHGHKIWAGKGPVLSSKGSFQITSACKYPEVAIRWIDYFYSEEGATFFYMGVEGVTYKRNPDGTLEYTIPELESMPEGTSFDQIVGKYTPYMGGGNPQITMTHYFKGGETHPIPLKAAQNVAPYAPKEIWAGFNFTIEEAERLNELQSDIHSYINTMRAEFISGKTSFDQWDEYVQQIEKMGLKEYMEIYQKGYERYKSN